MNDCTNVSDSFAHVDTLTRRVPENTSCLNLPTTSHKLSDDA